MSGDLEQMAIARLREAARTSERHYDAPLIITFSGGKDSSVLLELARRSGIAFEVAHNLTTVDAPDTVYFVRETFRRLEGDGIRCAVNYPYYKGERATMWSLIQAKGMPPTRIMRYCCDVLKERNNAKRYIATGVRWAESRARKARGVYESVNANPEKRVILFHDNDERRRLMEICAMKRRVMCNPIVDWTDADVWDFINSEKIPVNPLYCKGFSRVGCIGCPMARLKMRTFEFSLFPKYKAAYIRAFNKMLERRRGRGKLDDKWRIGDTGEAVFHWWMEDGVLEGQTDLWGGGERMTADERRSAIMPECGDCPHFLCEVSEWTGFDYCKCKLAPEKESLLHEKKKRPDWCPLAYARMEKRKRPRRLTRREKIIVSNAGFEPREWMLAGIGERYLLLANKATGARGYAEICTAPGRGAYFRRGHGGIGGYVMFAKITASKRRKELQNGGGLRVIRRGRRKYVVIPPHGAEPRKTGAKGTEGAKIADGKEKQNESV